jgi:hypothetical protein
MFPATPSPVSHILRAVVTTVVPEAAALDVRAWGEVESVVARALADRDPRVRRQLATFLRLLQILPVARHGRTFTRLSAAQRTAFLESVERSPIMIVRRGFWGLRTLIFMGYYTREDVGAAIGYRPHRDGWAARGRPITVPPLRPSLRLEP